MSEDFIDYAKLIDDAMHIIVQKALERVRDEGALQGEHHFFISFLTKFPGVEVPSSLAEQYPDEMTIVIQHQFDELVITDQYFSVVLSFDHVKEKIKVPFKALTSFADPSVKFGLQFRHYQELEQEDVEEEILASMLDNASEPPENPMKNKKKIPVDNVINIDHFRQNKKED